MYLCLRGKRYKGEQPLKEQNKVRFFACITLRHPIQLRNTLIFNTHYIMVQKSDEVRKKAAWYANTAVQAGADKHNQYNWSSPTSWVTCRAALVVWVVLIILFLEPPIY